MVWDIFVIVVTAGLVVSKLLDCLTTSARIRSIADEQNGLARRMMRALGVQTAIWGIFLIHSFILAITLYLLFTFYTETVSKVFYIFTGSIVTIIQFAVAESNHRRRLNGISRFILRWMR